MQKGKETMKGAGCVVFCVADGITNVNVKLETSQAHVPRHVLAWLGWFHFVNHFSWHIYFWDWSQRWRGVSTKHTRQEIWDTKLQTVLHILFTAYMCITLWVYSSGNTNEQIIIFKLKLFVRNNVKQEMATNQMQKVWKPLLNGFPNTLECFQEMFASSRVEPKELAIM